MQGQNTRLTNINTENTVQYVHTREDMVDTEDPPRKVAFSCPTFHALGTYLTSPEGTSMNRLSLRRPIVDFSTFLSMSCPFLRPDDSNLGPLFDTLDLALGANKAQHCAIPDTRGIAP
jgi:hypothetical protein